MTDIEKAIKMFSDERVRTFKEATPFMDATYYDMLKGRTDTLDWVIKKLKQIENNEL